MFCECPICGDLFCEAYYKRNEGLCDRCYLEQHEKEYRESLDLEFGYEYMKRDEVFWDLKLNYIFACMFTPEQIDEILYAVAKTLSKDYLADRIKENAEEGDPIEWIEEWRRWKEERKNAADK